MVNNQNLKASVSFVGDGTTNKFYFGFDYINKQFVKVQVGAGSSPLTYLTDYTVDDRSVVLKDTPAVGVAIRVYRETPSDRIVEWADGAFIKASQMTLENLQQLHLIEEAQDYPILSSLSRYPDGVNFNALGSRIAGVSDPKDPQDVVTKHYMENVQGGFVAANTKILNDTKATLSATQQVQNKSQANETLSKAWAVSTESPDGAEDTQSDTGKTQSSRTWALRAIQAEQNAKTSETNAKASETKAKTSETNAKTSETNAKASETNANTSETNAKNSETKAKTSENNAKASENNAKTSETNAGTYASNAKASETTAKTSETNSELSHQKAKKWAEATESPDGEADTDSTTGKTQSAKSWALAAKASEANAKTSATNAANSARALQADWNVTDTTLQSYIKNKPESVKSKYDLDLSSLDSTKFYPVVFESAFIIQHCEIISSGYSSSFPYNRNIISFSLCRQGWSDTPYSFTIEHYSCFDNKEITIGCIGYGTHNPGHHVVWLRGSLKYIIFSNINPTLHTSDYTDSDETYTVGTNYYGGDGNANVTIAFTPQETISRGSWHDGLVNGIFEMAQKDINGNAIVDTYAKKTDIANAAGFNILKRNKAYSIGDIAYSSHLPSWARLECVKAGTTAAYTVPSSITTVSRAGVLISDGTVTWIVDDVRDGNRVGDIVLKPTLNDGYIKANGATVKASEYPRLLKFAQDNSLCVSDSEWNTNSATKYVYDASADTLKVPNAMGRVLQGGDELSTKSAGLPNITGMVSKSWSSKVTSKFESKIPEDERQYSNGAFSPISKITQYLGSEDTRTEYYGEQGLTFDASRSSSIYGNSDTVQPPACCLIAQIKY